MTVKEVLVELQALSTPEHLAKLAHFGVKVTKAVGVKAPDMRKLAKKAGKSHELALELWSSQIHEARILASLVEISESVTEKQMDVWVNNFDSWDLCDVTCSLLAQTPFVRKKIDEYSTREDEFVKRTAFSLMCVLAVHDKEATDESFLHFFELIEREAWDDRNFVRKAVNWALRQIGKRNETLRLKAIESSERILNQGSKSARWIATDALRELKSEKVIQFVGKRRK